VSLGVGCTTGFGQLTIHLQNQEQGNAIILDPLNKITIANQPSGTPSVTVGDSGGSNPTGTYVFPCVIAGNYKITSSVYGTNSPCSVAAPTSCVTIGSSQSITATFQAGWNSLSNKQPSTAGVYVGQALAHLLDKPSFVQGFFGNFATYDDEQVSPSQNVLNLFSKTAECVDHPWFNPCNPVSAYNFVSDNIAGGSEWWTQAGGANGVVAGYSGVADLRAACDDFVKAGFTVVNGVNATDCGDVALASQGSTPPASAAYPHLSNNGQQIIFMLRSATGRAQFGITIADSINFLFGTPNNGATFPSQTPQCTVTYYLSGCLLKFVSYFQSVCVFRDTCNWNLYTGGWGLNIIGDQFYNFYLSSFASSFCGGSTGNIYFIPNYGSYCDPQLDTYAQAGETSASLAMSNQFFARAALEGALTGLTVPVWSYVSQSAALNGWNFQQCNGLACVPTESSIVNTLGEGLVAGGGYFSLLNMRQFPGYNPCAVPGAPANCASYAPGGGDPNLIRRGFSQDIFALSPFTASTSWELEIDGLIFESLLQANPMTGGVDGQVVDWQTTNHRSSFDPNEVGCNSINGCVTGVTTQLWQLRNDVYFQDGTPVTANDAAYTIIAYRDVPASQLQSSVLNVVSAMGLDCGPGQTCKILQVKLQGQGALFALNIGGLPIIPKHVWAPVCGDPPVAGGTCASPTFDPMSQGIMIGSGPWQCVVPAGFPNAGHVGGSCTITHPPTCPPGQLSCLSGQSISFGDQLLLTRYNNFVRCCPDDTSSGLYKLSWADKYNIGVVNILDLASVASRYGQIDPYWVNSNIAPGPTVNAVDLATVAIYFGHGITYPFLPSQLTDLDPQIDPFFCPATGC
jgi:ABC-type transport system substrate-binding protein